MATIFVTNLKVRRQLKQLTQGPGGWFLIELRGRSRPLVIRRGQVVSGAPPVNLLSGAVRQAADRAWLGRTWLDAPTQSTTDGCRVTDEPLTTRQAGAQVLDGEPPHRL